MPNHEHVCLQCGITFYNDRHTRSKYCSRECASLSHRKNLTSVCVVCGNEFPATGTRRCCSPECTRKLRSHKDPSKWIWKTCERCGKSFYACISQGNRFCSQSCGAKARPPRPRPELRRPENFVALICPECGIEFTVHKVQVEKRNRRCCSRECYSKYLSHSKLGEGNPQWRGGTSDQSRGRNWTAQKRAALKRDGYRCQICGKRRKLGQKYIVSVHHIKPYRLYKGDYQEANKLSNLITLCNKCHGAVEMGNRACPQPLL